MDLKKKLKNTNPEFIFVGIGIILLVIFSMFFFANSSITSSSNEEKEIEERIEFDNKFYNIKLIDISFSESKNEIVAKIEYFLKDKNYNYGLFISPQNTLIRTNGGYERIIDFKGEGLYSTDKFIENNRNVEFGNLKKHLSTEEFPLSKRLVPENIYKGKLIFKVPDNTDLNKKVKVEIYVSAMEMFYYLGEEGYSSRKLNYIGDNVKFPSNYEKGVNHYSEMIELYQE